MILLLQSEFILTLLNKRWVEIPKALHSYQTTYMLFNMSALCVVQVLIESILHNTTDIRQHWQDSRASEEIRGEER